MPFHITYNEADEIVECVYEMPFSRVDFESAVVQNLEVAAQHDTLMFLGDCTAMPAAASMFDVYALVEVFDSMNLDRRMREALIIPPDPAVGPTYDFLVTATSNRGIKVAVFTDEDRAREWLREQGEQIRKTSG